MNKETKNIRTEINRLSDLAIVGWLKVLLITCVLCITAIFLSLLQPIYIADKIAIFWVILGIFQVGILGGFAMSERIREDAFEVRR